MFIHICCFQCNDHFMYQMFIFPSSSPGSIMFHVRRRPSDAQPRRRKKKTSVSTGGGTSARALEPFLVEVAPDGSSLENGRRIRINDVIEVNIKHTVSSIRPYKRFTLSYMFL